ncbi:hypothetical protein RJ55_02405 [Drechmeria coniospora]|nr:hypothetical protein RJ55_02405 [Drechmeria coniospora]
MTTGHSASGSRWLRSTEPHCRVLSNTTRLGRVAQPSSYILKYEYNSDHFGQYMAVLCSSTGHVLYSLPRSLQSGHACLLPMKHGFASPEIPSPRPFILSSPTLHRSPLASHRSPPLRIHTSQSARKRTETDPILDMDDVAARI